MAERVVIDSNMLQSQTLRDFFMASPDHYAVLPDYLWFEIYKQGSAEGLNAAFSVIQDFPDQLVGFRSSGDLALLDPAHPNMVQQMLHADMPELMQQTFQAAAQAERGDRYVLRQLGGHWSRATAHAHETIKGALNIVESLPEIEEIFTPNEIQICRTKSTYTPQMAEKIFSAADQIYETLIHGPDVEQRGPLGDHYYDSHFYRLALGIMIYSLWWIGKGSQLPKRLDRLRNDMVDLHFAVYATYFDGLLTDDAKAHWMYSNLYAALKLVGARHGFPDQA